MMMVMVIAGAMQRDGLQERARMEGPAMTSREGRQNPSTETPMLTTAHPCEAQIHDAPALPAAPVHLDDQGRRAEVKVPFAGCQSQ